MHDIKDAYAAVNVNLIDEDAIYLDKLYILHPIIGAIDKNPAQDVVLLDKKK